MHDKRERKMLKTREHENVYIVKKIVKNFNEFVLLSTMYYDFTN